MSSVASMQQSQAAAPSVRRSGVRDLLTRAPVSVVVVLICFLWSLPTVGLLITSFRPTQDINTSGWWTAFQLPFNFTLDNYNTVINADGLGNAFANSLLVTIPSVVIPITIAAFAAYAFAWMKFPGRDLFFATVVALLVVPLHTSLIPVLRLYVNLDLNGTFLGIWLAHTGFGLPLAIYLLYGFIANIPRELIESAAIDGASPFTTFTRLVIPLSVPAIASFAIFQFLWVWNDLLVALVFLGTNAEVEVVTRSLSELVGSRGQSWEVLTAGAFVTMLMPLLIFIFLQRFFVRGLMAGAVKGG
jgi:alpha-glucoside transport system permease protein